VPAAVVRKGGLDRRPSTTDCVVWAIQDNAAIKGDVGELAQMRPQADLAGDVVRYAGYLEHRGWSIDEREVASPIVPLILNFGEPFRIRMGASGPQDHRSFVAGLYDGSADVASTWRAHCMQVDFTPLGAYRFFALPMRELAARAVALDQVRAFDDLAGRPYDAPDWAARFALLDRFVRRRSAEAPACSPPIAWAWRQLRASGGRVRVGVLADELGWSRKHLAQRFAIEVGAGPKTVGRFLRFAGARRSIDVGVRGREHGLGGSLGRIGLRRSGASGPRVPRDGGRDPGRLCAGRCWPVPRSGSRDRYRREHREVTNLQDGRSAPA
jgi:AraC-like DNA-binding protein